jgi:hypothetical protein
MPPPSRPRRFRTGDEMTQDRWRKTFNVTMILTIILLIPNTPITRALSALLFIAAIIMTFKLIESEPK